LINGFDSEVLFVACLCSVPCSILGCFLFLSKRIMQVEAISHAVLLGVVVVFILGFTSSLLVFFVGACVAAFAAVHGSALIENFLRFYKSSSVALIFPALFAIAVVILNTHLRNTNFDTHTVLLGELAFVGLDRLEWKQIDFGPIAAWKGFSALFVSFILVGIFFQGLLRFVFDPILAHTMGTRVLLLRTIFLAAICFAAVAAIDVVGTVLTLGLFALPPTAGRLVTKHVWSFVLVSCLFSLSGTILGYTFGLLLDVSLAGSISLALGIPLIIALIVSRKMF
jgi:manganese/zinc/iron transport system permease protein